MYLSPLPMKRLLSSVATIGLLTTPALALAHESQNFTIGGQSYSFVVGSLNEPLIVDDKSGVDLAIKLLGEHAEDEAHEDGDSHAAGVPVEGLETTLKVEIKAGNKSKTMDLTTQYGKPGSYKAVFIPTVQTTLTYRIFGEINKIPVDLSFTCNPAGHPVTAEDTTETQISDAVVRTLKKGAFGCPQAKADLGFPEASITTYDLQQSAGQATGPMGTAAIALGALGFVFGLVALKKSSKK
jgi:hypothetical protein